ncbi:MAG: hypothetical protein KIT57_12700 [Blastocatellales bacterium]|nr:hypothetical protein [Blastocatellales bacterium]
MRASIAVSSSVFLVFAIGLICLSGLGDDAGAQAPERKSVAERLKDLEAIAPTYEYTCPMHAQVRQAQEGTCPRCGMPLSSVKPSFTGAYNLDVTADPAAPEPGERVRLAFVVTHPTTGARVKDFVVNHEKLFHLFIVSRDLGEYQHIHPQLEDDGAFIIETVLPRPGLYKLHADFFPTGGTIQLIHREIATKSYSERRPSPVRLAPDKTLVKIVDGTRIRLELGEGKPAAGVLIPLKYTLTDARSGAPVRDLEPYLGAWGHTLMLNADQSQYLHSHPTEMLPDGEDPSKLRGGPEVEFRSMFAEPGDYRIWTQFQRSGRIITVHFTVRIDR